MPEQNRKNELLYRVYIVLLAFVLLAVVISYRVVKIAIIEGDQWRSKKEKRYMEWRPLKTQRGNIYADDGQSLLATSVEFFEIRMDPVAPSDKNFYAELDGLCSGLAKVLKTKSAAQWKKEIYGTRKAYKQKSKGGTRNLLITDEVDHIGLEKLAELPMFRLGRYKGGFIKIKKYVREKPYRELASRTIGLDRVDGAVGLEYAFDKTLMGDEKKAYMQRIGPDLYVPVYDPTDFEIVKGADIVTTLDMDLQDIAQNELFKGIKENGAEGGCAIIMDVQTGRIKAIANISKNKDGAYGEFDNFAVARASEPGSTMKAATVLALLDDGLATSNSIVDFSSGKKKFYDRWMYDSHEHGIEKSTLREAFEVSSNVGISSAAHAAYNNPTGRQKFVSKLKQFGLADLTGVEIRGEPKPYIKDPIRNKDIWYGTTIPWMSHGYEMLMTPMQTLRFYNAIANGGRLMDAQLISEIRKDDKVIKKFDPILINGQIAKRESIFELQSMLQGVVDNGTAKSLKSDYYHFAGKTGTTKVGYGGSDVTYNASFVGYWPLEAPKYTLIVMVYGLKGERYYGHQVAGPIFKRIMDWSYAIKEKDDLIVGKEEKFQGKYRGRVYGYKTDYSQIFKEVNVAFSPNGSWIKGISGEEGEVLSGRAKISTNQIPDLKGMGARDAVYVLENLGMEVRLTGSGKVSRQSIDPGQRIASKEITLYLN